MLYRLTGGRGFIIRKSIFNYRMFAVWLIVLFVWGYELFITDNYFAWAFPKSGVDATFFWENLIVLSGFSRISAVLPGLPFAYSLLEERNSGYLRIDIYREGVDKYIIRKLLYVIISGMIVMIVPYLLINIPILAVTHPTDPNTCHSMIREMVWGKILFICGGKLYLIFQGIVFALYGAMWALIVLAVTLFVRNKYIAFVVPFIINFISKELITGKLNSYTNTELWWRGDAERKSIVISFVYYIIPTALISILIIWVFKRQVRNGKI